ncbi:NAD(P)H-binding protein [Nocardia sp. NPDC050413]|uniref:NAD(P)H-binding protein n=1 Tax=Nocardia sp. NPDC050413 TaxID=3155784 RepID=UPI00340FC293
MGKRATGPRIAVFGAGGVIGSAVVGECASRGYEVTGVTRNSAVTVDGVVARSGDMGDPLFVTQVAADHGVIICATAPTRAGDTPQNWLADMRNVIEYGEGTRLVLIGGAGDDLASSPGCSADDDALGS